MPKRTLERVQHYEYEAAPDGADHVDRRVAMESSVVYGVWPPIVTQRFHATDNPWPEKFRARQAEWQSLQESAEYVRDMLRRKVPAEIVRECETW